MPPVIPDATAGSAYGSYGVVTVIWNPGFTVWRAQPWPPRISFLYVFDRFLTSLVDHMIKTFFCPPDLCLFSGDVTGSSEINSHQTCQKPVKNMYKTYAGWPRLEAQDCKAFLHYAIFLARQVARKTAQCSRGCLTIFLFRAALHEVELGSTFCNALQQLARPLHSVSSL